MSQTIEQNETCNAKVPTPDRTAPYIFSFLFLLLLIHSFLFELFVIPSESMEPGLLTGDYIAVSKYAYGYSRYSFPGNPDIIKKRVFGSQPKRGDVMVFRHHKKPYNILIKRVIGLSGERIKIVEDKVYINGRRLKRKVIDASPAFPVLGIYQEKASKHKQYPIQFSQSIHESKDKAKKIRVYRVPKDHFFVMGDNRDNSLDSRFRKVGFIPYKHIIGRAEMVLFSKDAVGSFRWDRFFKNI